jgi:hypothetical protein
MQIKPTARALLGRDLCLMRAVSRQTAGPLHPTVGGEGCTVATRFFGRLLPQHIRPSYSEDPSIGFTLIRSWHILGFGTELV